MLKKVILFVALAAPVLIFAFLKLFGKNEFEVPVYWSDGVAVAGCPPKPGLYTLPDSALNAWGWKGDKATLLVLDESKVVTTNLARVSDLFEQGQRSTFTTCPHAYCWRAILRRWCWSTIKKEFVGITRQPVVKKPTGWEWS